MVGRHGDPGLLVGGYGRVAGPRRLQYPIGWGTLGYALPASIGAAAVGQRPVLAVCGDGGFMYAVGELAALVQEQPARDRARRRRRRLRDAPLRPGPRRRRAPGVDLFRPDFAALAASFGIPASVLGDVAELAPALTDALGSREPRMVVLPLALTPPRTTSPRWRD